VRQRQWSMVTSTRYVGRSVCWTSPRNLSRSPAQCNQHALRAEYLRCVTGVPARGLIRGEHHWKRHRNRCDPHRRRIPSGLSGLQLRWNDPRQRSSDGDRAGLRIDAIDVPAGGARSRGRGGASSRMVPQRPRQILGFRPVPKLSHRTIRRRHAQGQEQHGQVRANDQAENEEHHRAPPPKPARVRL